MFKKGTIVRLLGILAIPVLIASQIIILRGVWEQKDEMLYSRYRSLTQEAASSLRSTRQPIDPYDTVKIILNYASRQFSDSLVNIKSDSVKLVSEKQNIYDYFLYVLNNEQDYSSYLSSFFDRMGFEKDFIHRIIINNLDIIDGDTLNIYRDETFRNFSPSFTAANQGSKSSILVQRQWFTGDNYNLNFEYYIDFSDKQRMILREMATSLSMSLLSIILVVTLFIITYNNLIKEKRLSDLKTDFINNMTHELKTPLATITVAGKTLEMEKVRQNDSMILDTAKLIGKQSVHLNQLINMILEISMWERTQFELSKKPMKIDEILNDILLCFQNGGGKTAQIQSDIHLEGISAELDTVYFTTMINNLLSNAVKYNENDPEIKVKGNCYNGMVHISISDNGIGISKTDQKHIFEKFYRASGGNIHKYKGLGLGLYYVKKIAEAHGGDVKLSSKPGRGSTFTIIIPYLI
jgi:two-component system phosphate regulon sensor histidine kinase PhoR